MYNKNNKEISNNRITAIIFGFLIIIFIFSDCGSDYDEDNDVGIVNNNVMSISELISSDSFFRYSTSLTSSYDNQLQSDVYVSSMDVPETASYILEKTEPLEYSNLSNNENISIMYDYDYVFIYAGEDNTTYVQMSSRKYAYSGPSVLYRHHSPNSWNFYRDYYYIRAFKDDSSRYSGNNYYTVSHYSPDPINTKFINSSTTVKPPYKGSTQGSSSGSGSSSHSTGKSVRSSSVGTRDSIGGGTSFGK